MEQALLEEIARRSSEHLGIVLSSVAIATALALPAGIAAHRSRLFRTPALIFSSAMQTVPSLALFGFLIPFIGIGKRTALVALILYALLPVIRNTVAGLSSVDASLVDVSRAIGLRPLEVLRYVEIPLAAPAIFAGVRIAAVTTVGTATIAGVIGGGGLGVFIFRGIATVDSTLLLAGAVPAAIIALLLDGGLGWIERKLSQSS